jgi:hypothetical protein
MPVRPIIPARQIAAICAALRPGQRAELAMPGGTPIRIYGAPIDGTVIPDGTADPGPRADTPPDTTNVHELAARVRSRMAGQRQA